MLLLVEDEENGLCFVKKKSTMGRINKRTGKTYRKSTSS